MTHDNEICKVWHIPVRSHIWFTLSKAFCKWQHSFQMEVVLSLAKGFQQWYTDVDLTKRVVSNLWFIIMMHGTSPRGWFDQKLPSYQYMNSHCGDKAIFYLHHGISYTGKIASLYWIIIMSLFANIPGSNIYVGTASYLPTCSIIITGTIINSSWTQVKHLRHQLVQK